MEFQSSLPLQKSHPVESTLGHINPSCLQALCKQDSLHSVQHTNQCTGWPRYCRRHWQQTSKLSTTSKLQPDPKWLLCEAAHLGSCTASV